MYLVFVDADVEGVVVPNAVDVDIDIADHAVYDVDNRADVVHLAHAFDVFL